MRKVRCLLATLVMATLPAVSPAQRPAPTTGAITIADLRSRLFRIADDSMLGRETGSAGASKTADYVAAEFRRLGLSPAGDNGGWFQVVPFWVVGSGIHGMISKADAAAGQSADMVIVADRDFVVIPRPTKATLDNVVAVAGGSVDDPEHWIDAGAAAGKLVVITGSDSAVGARLTPMLMRALNSPRFAGARAIAVAVLDRMPRAAAIDMGRFRVTRDSTRSEGPILMLVTERAAATLIGTGPAGRRWHSDSAITVEPVPYPARNVVGVLRGRDPVLRGEYVSVTGHNDHVGVCRTGVDHDSLRAFNRVLRPMGADTRTWNETPEADAQIARLRDSLRKAHPARTDSICNGADDDGTGTVAILELAESFASMPAPQRPRRSVLFVSHTGEERGLVGSAWYTDHATVPVDSIVAEIDEDMIGRGAADDLPKGGPTYLEVVGARRLSKEFGDLLEAANAKQPVPFVFNYEFDVPGHPLQYYCRADHYSYARYGIPSVAFSRGEHLDYHQVTDEAQYIDYPDMMRVINMVRSAVLSIANLDHRPKVDLPKGDPHATCKQ